MRGGKHVAQRLQKLSVAGEELVMANVSLGSVRHRVCESHPFQWTSIPVRISCSQIKAPALRCAALSDSNALP